MVYLQCGYYHEAEIIQVAVKEFIYGILGTDHPKAMDILLAISEAYWQQSHVNKAAEIQKQVLQMPFRARPP
jgi:hypothetical protein